MKLLDRTCERLELDMSIEVKRIEIACNTKFIAWDAILFQ